MGEHVETTTDAMAASAAVCAEAGKVKPGGEELPLVTFALFAYNQEKYIREAVEGALAQTYEPLQIILSDDNSTDGTFKVLSSVAEAYTGPHTIVLNRNPDNLGIGGHINKVMTISEGELIVVAAGDDISVPNRTKVLVDAWNENGRREISIFSAMDEIDRESRATGNVYRSLKKWDQISAKEMLRRNLGVFGASHAWSPAFFSRFRPMNKNIINEDHVIPFRAILLGGVRYVDEVLVNYRANMGVASNYGDSSKPSYTQRRASSMLVRPYRVSVQRGSDLKHMARNDLLEAARVRRAEDLFRYWLSSGRRITMRKLIYFVRRCRFIWLTRETALQARCSATRFVLGLT